MYRHLSRRNTDKLHPHWMLLVVAALITLTACASRNQKGLVDPRRCMQQVPRNIEGLTIVKGPRTSASVIHDMVPAICNGQVLFNRMKLRDTKLQAGMVVFRVKVEYTGEVIAVQVEETTIRSDVFLRKVSDFIMDTDFVNWAPNDIDTVFIYPAQFGR